MMKYFGDCEASEIIVNRSICVKEGHRIRNIKYEDDLEKELLVFVNNVVDHGEYTVFAIPPYTPLRYAVLNVGLR